MVFVDDLAYFSLAQSVPLCHLLPEEHSAPAMVELHAFAKRLGLRPEWFYRWGSWPHYELTAEQRVKAVKRGAVQTTTRAYMRAMARHGSAAKSLLM